VRGGGPATLQALFDLTYRTCWAGQKSERTAERNGQEVVELIGPAIKPSEITESTVDMMVCKLEAKGNSNGTINRKLAALSKMMTLAHRRGFINRKPHLERRREAQGRIRWLSQQEEAQLLTTFRHFGRDDFADLVVMLVDTGLRVSEALKMEWRDIDLAEGWVRLWDTKNGGARSVPLTTRVVEMLQRLQGIDPQGPFSEIAPRTFNEFWVRVRSHMGLSQDAQFVPHALRHTYISRLVQAGVDLRTVQELAGHKTLAMTFRYAHLAPKNLKAAVDVLDRLTASRHAVQPGVGALSGVRTA
jgi:integrase